VQKRFSKVVFFLVAQLILVGDTGIAQNRLKLTTPDDYIVSAASVSLFIGGNYFYRHKTPLTEAEINSLSISNINSLDRRATRHYSVQAEKASDVMLVSSIVLPAVLLADNEIRKDFGALTVVYIQTTVMAGAEIQFVKGLLDRARPFVYNPAAPMSAKRKADANASFFSGHTAMTASAAAFTATAYSIYNPNSKALPYLYISAAAIPITTGYLRYRAGKHFPTDIAAGLIVGIANGFLMASLHKN
jgi:hypothetical protein